MPDDEEDKDAEQGQLELRQDWQAGTLASTSSTVVVVQSGQSEDCPSNCMGYLYN